MKVSIVLPTYNEKENISIVVPEIFEVFEKNKIEGEVIVVDDSSPDGTAEVAKKLSKKYAIRLIERKGKLGLGTAYLAGFRDAISRKSEIIMSMDADQSHNPKNIPAIINLVEKGFDVGIGSRYVQGGGIKNWPLSRKLTSFGANQLAKILLGSKANDNTSGFRAYKRSVLESMDFEKIHSNGYSFLVELLFRAKSNGYKIGETPIIFSDRIIGKSKLSSNEISNFFLMVLRLFFERAKNFLKFKK